ncbi:hypothetical protein GTP55_22940 [Duganella sp. FT109W]|uniref:Uncharacterized protein n=1 Tax=Duganella margarita TaxID=2692170 RepID=A0ABW9WMB1_9BURK|nr:hypothetical protein [Duganella margarita]MYN42206.1 hypothetical protein [Duganella margarita]
MSTISNLGARLPSLFTGTQADSKTPALQKTQGVSAANSSSKALDLDSRVASLGNATVDFAQSFVNSFTQALFGDDAKGAVIDFDSASLEASSSVAVGYQHTSGAKGTTDAAAFSLTDSSHFIGKGTITTADGRKFDFEVEVQYNAELSAAASQSSSADDASSTQPAKQSGDGKSISDLPSVQLPNIDFPGTLADLFQLIGRDLQTALSTSNNSNDKSDGIDRNTLRGLSLRLLNLVDSKDTNIYAAPTAADKAKAAASGTETPASTEATTPTTAASTPAADAAAAAGDATPANAAST